MPGHGGGPPFHHLHRLICRAAWGQKGGTVPAHPQASRAPFPLHLLSASSQGSPELSQGQPPLHALLAAPRGPLPVSASAWLHELSPVILPLDFRFPFKKRCWNKLSGPSSQPMRRGWDIRASGVCH